MRQKVMGLLLAVMLLLPGSQVMAEASQSISVERIAGVDRYETAAKISQRIFSSNGQVILVSGESYQDALAAGAYANLVDAPILLTHKAGLPDSTIAEIARLQAKKAIVIGGPDIIANYDSQYLTETKAIYGKDPYETSREVAKLFPVFSRIGYATGMDFADAVMGSPLLRAYEAPLVLTDGTKQIEPSAVVFGGTVRIPDGMIQDAGILRLAGANRYATSVEIAKYYKQQHGDFDKVIVASGRNFPDALAAASLSEYLDAPIFLTEPGDLPAEIKAYLVEEGIREITIVGGTEAVSTHVEDQLKNVYGQTALYAVTRVLDGDTIVVNLEGKEETIRLIGIDTPESVHPDPERNTEYGEVASAFTKDLLEGKNVSLELDVQERDQYGRLLAYIYLGEVMVNKALLEAGMAQVLTYPPNVRYVDDFRALEKTARESEVGLWGWMLSDVNPGYGGMGLDYRWVDGSGQPLIKGNISEGGKIYHTPNSPNYSRTNINTSAGERWFYTEREALDAGWRAPRN